MRFFFPMNLSIMAIDAADRTTLAAAEHKTRGQAEG
jgi:hypothetical protein